QGAAGRTQRGVLGSDVIDNLDRGLLHAFRRTHNGKLPLVIGNDLLGGINLLAQRSNLRGQALSNFKLLLTLSLPLGNTLGHFQSQGLVILLQRFNGTGFVIRNQVIELSKRSEEHTSELQSRENLVCRLLLEKKKKKELIAS